MQHVSHFPQQRVLFERLRSKIRSFLEYAFIAHGIRRIITDKHRFEALSMPYPWILSFDSGSLTLNHAPLPGFDSTSISPLWFWVTIM